MRDDVIRVVEAHMNGLGARNVSASPFHEDIEFVGPIGPPIKGGSRGSRGFHRIFSYDKGHPHLPAYRGWGLVCHDF
jgi:hypothetical protein